MGLFNYHYTKPGPGVSKDEPKKKGIFLYFELFFRHFWDFIKENLMYTIASIPMLIILYVAFTVFDVFSLQKWAIENDYGLMYESVKFLAVILAVILFGSGPASAAMAYMMRCITREEHCFYLSDFIEKFKENFKNTIILSLIDIIALTLIIPVSLKFYFTQFNSTGSMIYLVLLSVALLAFVIYLMMHIYFYQFTITYELNFGNTLKNSVIMALAYLPLNVLIILIPTLLTTLLFIFINPLFALILSLLLWISFMRYPIEFLASRIILNKLLNNNENEGTEN